MKQSILTATLFFLLLSCTDEIPTIVNQTSLSNTPTLIAINGNTSVTLCWTPDISALAKQLHDDEPSIPDVGPLSEIIIYKSMDEHFVLSSATKLAVLPLSASSYVDSNLHNGWKYFYRLVPVEQLPNGMRRYRESSNIVVATPLDYSSISMISYTEHIQPIFASGCAFSGCHADNPNEEEPSPEDEDVPEDDDGGGLHFQKTSHTGSRIHLTSWEELMSGDRNGAVVVPFKSTKSHLLFHVNYDTLIAPVSSPHMPKTGVNLPDEQIQLLKRWIDEGAQNDIGAIALTNNPEGRILVTNQADDLVTVIDRKTSLVARYIQAGVADTRTQQPHAPHNITVDSMNDCYYVNVVSAGKILKFRLHDYVKLGEVSGILSPTQVALTSTGDTAFVAQFATNNNAIRFFNTKTMQLYPQQISSSLLNKPHGVQISPDFSEVWVTGAFSDNMMVVKLSDLSTSTIPLIENDTLPPGTGNRLIPYQTTMTSDGKFVYVTCQKSNEVRVIDRDSMKVVKIIPVGQFPLIPDITPDNRYVYVPNRNTNSVSIIRTSDNTAWRTISNVGPQPHGIDISADGKYAYVSCENVSAQIPPHHPTEGSKVPGFVSVIKLSTNQVVKKIEVGAFAAGIAVVD